MLSGPSLVDTVFVMQTRRAHDAAFRMITKYLPLLDCVHCHICLGISWRGDFCDENALGLNNECIALDDGGAPCIITHIDAEPIDVYIVPTDEWCSGPTDLSQMFLDRILQRKPKTDPLGPRGLNNNCCIVAMSNWVTKN